MDVDSIPDDESRIQNPESGREVPRPPPRAGAGVSFLPWTPDSAYAAFGFIFL